MTKVILVLNTGSSSVKFSVFSVGDGGLLPLFRGEFEGIGTAPISSPPRAARALRMRTSPRKKSRPRKSRYSASSTG
jgi:acetate kinase